MTDADQAGLSDTPLSNFDKAVEQAKSASYLLRLYVAGNSEKSARAILNLRRLCEEYLPGRYEMEVIDVLQQPDLAREQQVIATPTLIKVLPPPSRRVIGDLTHTERILVGLHIPSAG